MQPASAAPAPLLATNQHRRQPLLARVVTAACNRIDDWRMERRLGIRTTGRREVPHADAERYEPVPYRLLDRMFARLELGAADVFVDLGSGKGRVVCAAARLPVAKVIGVELVPALHFDAEENVGRLRGAQAPVELICGSATEFDFADVTALALLNPFSGETMASVLRNLRRSLEQQPRVVRIAYVNAVCAHLFAAQPWLKLVDAWEMRPWSRIKSPVYFYVASLPRPAATPDLGGRIPN